MNVAAAFSVRRHCSHLLFILLLGMPSRLLVALCEKLFAPECKQ